jgi:chromosome segregation ATPase
MDPELKQLLMALVDGQVKLAEGQAKTDTRMDALVQAQAKTEARIDALAQAQAKTEARIEALAARMDALAATQNELAGDVRVLARAQERTERRLEQVVDRLDRFTDAIMRGFTTGAEKHSGLEDRVRKLEGAVFGGTTPAVP